ncbi:unnamed protein product [Clavelina lepadiformis]|uniref:Uncharacterized protein n=1 Tax=Clavelina lepadiformis TaxID=159417 RepID=A0ABP0G0U2_CLALP
MTDMPVSQPPLSDKHFIALASSTDSETDESSVACLQRRVAGERWPYYPNQEDINDLVRELSLTKLNAELLISRLKQWDLLDDSVRITRHRGFSVFFTFKDDLCYCHDIEGDAFKHIQEQFPKLSEAKTKARVFVGPELKRLINSINFPEMLSEVERRVWTSFVSVVNGFLGNHKTENYMELVDELVDAYWKMGCRMSLKLHVLHAYLDEFKDNMGDCSEKQGERFHQDIRYFEERYQGQYNENMMGDYIWNLLRESELTYRRQSRKNVSL